jgi:hypothetical protein
MAVLTLQPDGTDGKDTYIRASTPDTNYDGSYLSVFVDSGALSRQALIQFDLTSIPTSSVVSSAILTLTNEENRISTDTLAVHRLTQAWVEAQATWNIYSTGNSWASAVGDYDATADATFVAPALIDQTVDVDITTLVQEWVNGTSNLGLLLKVQTISANKGGVFESSDNATAGRRPKLVVTYGPPPTAISGSYSFFM